MNSKFISIAKRENNTKRGYLIVNPLQGKHIPVSPSKSLSVFKDLASLINGKYTGEKILFIGFAETATAIGAHVAVLHQSPYIQTTREIIPGAEYLFFSEEHSHATEQKLVKNDLDKILPSVSRIIFVEDEVTTGKTILNIINVLKKTYNQNLSFSVMSILNGMDSENLAKYNSLGIDLFYLEKTDHSGFEKTADSYKTEGNYLCPDLSAQNHIITDCKGYINGRRLTNGSDYIKACNFLADQIVSQTGVFSNKKILVTGTEEFMYPAIITGERFEKMGNTVRTHSTTRSPISVYKDQSYPLNERYQLQSVYDPERKTFIYNIESYDKVFVITDSNLKEERGLLSLLGALETKNQDIRVFRWS